MSEPLACDTGDMIDLMPGTNLTREEAQTRAALLDVDVVHHRPGPHDRRARPSARPPRSASPAASPGPTTFADLVGRDRPRDHAERRAAVDPATAYADSRIALDGLAADNELVVRADCTYSRTGEGLHRFVDPVDDRVYLYSQFEVPGRPPRVTPRSSSPTSRRRSRST